MRTFSLALMLFAAIPFAACTPYNPDLGVVPFLCGPADQDPRCPSGYECTSMTSTGSGSAMITREVCMVPEGEIPVDGRDANCADDRSLEPNDSKETAWVTPVDQTTQPFTLAQLSICPAGDKDNYSVMITTAMRNLEMIVEWEADGAELQAAIANSMGVPIANATATVANTKRAYTPNLNTGMYYVQVYGPPQGSLTTNNYKLTITASGP